MGEVALVETLDDSRSVHDHLDLGAGLADDSLFAFVVVVVVHRRPIGATPEVVLLLPVVCRRVGRLFVRAGFALPGSVLAWTQRHRRTAVEQAGSGLLVVELRLGGDSGSLDQFLCKTKINRLAIGEDRDLRFGHYVIAESC